MKGKLLKMSQQLNCTNEIKAKENDINHKRNPIFFLFLINLTNFYWSTYKYLF